MPVPGSLGEQGERFVERELEADGHTILARNWRCRFGEIDLITRKEGVIRFVEVKTRRSGRFGHGVESVDERKQQKLRMLAERYLNETEQDEADCAFDVAVITVGRGSFLVEFIPNAF